jgi:hypothetical protein
MEKKRVHLHGIMVIIIHLGVDIVDLRKSDRLRMKDEVGLGLPLI